MKHPLGNISCNSWKEWGEHAIQVVHFDIFKKMTGRDRRINEKTARSPKNSKICTYEAKMALVGAKAAIFWVFECTFIDIKCN